MNTSGNCFICDKPGDGIAAQEQGAVGKCCREKAVVELGGGDKAHQCAALRDLPRYRNLDRVKYDERTDQVELGAPIGWPTFTDVEYVYTSHCLEHVENIRATLNACHGMLSQAGGVMEVVVPHKDSDKAHAIDHVRFFTRETFKSLEYRDIADYGFKPWKILYLEGEKDAAGNLEIRCRMTPAIV